ncbi:immunity 52 family protein [Hyalangium sp. s54d21]|uniref:Immunity 52 family protein n=1 Tax=Hyalangium rubrum TaxID=3103134 RepID=A0ABU5HI54_9BACT|nr:immunity 52 family protein [Hyalangium sp. s54d21]MDY7233153.1 immunity 52 family protein [Hyalangium sp. s54d21]
MIRRGKDRVLEQLGFSFGGWTGEDDYEATAFTVFCGGCSDRVLNTCTFTLPSRGFNAERILTAPVLTGLVRTMATAWDPDWGECLSSPHMDLMPELTRPTVRVGWITYVSRRLGTVPPLHAPVRIERVEDKGTLILLTPDRFTVHNPEHVALAERVRELLDRAGLLHPSPAQGSSQN